MTTTVVTSTLEQLEQWQWLYRDWWELKKNPQPLLDQWRRQEDRLQQPVIDRGDSPYTRLIWLADGKTEADWYALLASKMPAWSHWTDLGAIRSARQTIGGDYAIWTPDCFEACDGSEELTLLWADAIRERCYQTQTLAERLAHEAIIYLETGEEQHLDQRDVSLCAGSRGSDGSVPGVRWRGDRLHVDWYDSSDALLHFLRARVAVSF